jgi:hypothetical protein
MFQFPAAQNGASCALKGEFSHGNCNFLGLLVIFANKTEKKNLEFFPVNYPQLSLAPRRPIRQAEFFWMENLLHLPPPPPLKARLLKFFCRHRDLSLPSSLFFNVQTFD